MPITKAVHLLARSGGVGSVNEGNKSEALCSASLSVFGEEDSSNSAEPLEEVAQFLFLGHLRYLDCHVALAFVLPGLFVRLDRALWATSDRTEGMERKKVTGGGTYIRHTQRRQIVSLEFATHPLAGALSALSQMRRHVAAATGAETAGGLATLFVLGHGVGDGGGTVVRGRHRVLERTPRGEMLALADSALDLLVAQLFLQTLLLGFAAAGLCLFGLHVLPVSARAEQDVLPHGRRVRLRSFRFALLQSELRPGPALRHHRVHSFLVHSGAGLARHLHFAALVVEAVQDRRLRAIFVHSRHGRRQRRWVVGLFRVRDVVGPVGAAVDFRNFR